MGRRIKFGRPRTRRIVTRRKPIYLLILISAIAVSYALGRLSSDNELGGDSLVVLHNWLETETADSVEDVSFGVCGRPPHDNCVIDGDTFYFQHQSIRIADIDTPETNPPRCEQEALLGERATRRLLQLLNSGPFEIETIGERDEDQFGRKLRVLTRNGSSIGGILATEGLARIWTGRRLPWCE